MTRVRIGHGLYIPKLDSEKGRKLMQEIKEAGAVLEFQLTSNVRLNNLNTLKNHPIKKYLENDIKCVQGTDGCGAYGTDTVDEQLALQNLLGLSNEDFLKMRKVEDEELDKLDIELTLDQIHYQSDAVYWNASAALATLEAAARFVEIVNRQYSIIQDRFNDGAISRTDLLMISTRLKEAELQYIKARQNYTLALQKLNILMGEEPNNPVDSLYTIDTASAPVQILSLENVLQRRADYESTEVNIMKSQAQRKAALSQFNPQLNMYFSGGWATATPNLGYDVSFNPIVGINLNIPIFRWGARFKTNRQQKAYISIQKLQQSYVTDNINEELSAALTKLTETEYQVKTAKETMSLANENLDLVSFSYNEGKANMVDVLSAQLSWTQAHTNLINAYLSEKMAVAEYRKVISE